MANILAAIGSAAPALTQEWRSIQAEERQRRQDEDKAQLFPIQKQEAEMGVAIHKEQLSKIQFENKIREDFETKKKTPVNVRQMLTNKGFLPDSVKSLMETARAYGIDNASGIGSAGDFMEFFQDSVKSGEFGKQLSGNAQYWSNRLATLKKKYQDSQMTQGIEPITKLSGEIADAEAKVALFGGALVKDQERIRNMEAFGNNIKRMKKDGTWNDYTVKEQGSLMQAYESGSEPLWKDAMGKILARKEDVGKVPSSGNAVDSAIRSKFGTEALTNPKLAEQADRWLATPEGKAEVERWAKTLTPPAITFLQTSEGFVPVTTKGPGTGTVGKPTGLKKPLTDAQTSKVGELNAVLKNIDKTKELYGYGTDNEHGEWVGPVAGRTGGVEAKFLGTASKDQVKFYAYVKDMQDALLRARSGAQINEQEYARLVNFLPDPNLPPTTFKAKLERFKEATEIVMEEKLAAFEQAGYGTGKLRGKNKSDTRQVSPISKKAWIEKAKAANKGMNEKDIEAEFDKRYREK